MSYFEDFQNPNSDIADAIVYQKGRQDQTNKCQWYIIHRRHIRRMTITQSYVVKIQEKVYFNAGDYHRSVVIACFNHDRC